MTNSFDTQREVLRLRLQAQRQLFGSQISTTVHDSNYPRSVTMSLLSRRSSVTVWAVTELLPLVVLHFLGNSGHGLLHALQLHRGSKPRYDDPDAYPLRNC